MTIRPINQDQIAALPNFYAQESKTSISNARLAFARPESMFQQLSGLIRSTESRYSGSQLQGPTVTSGDASWTSQNLRISEPFNSVEANPSAPGRGNPAYPDRAENGNAFRITTLNQQNIDRPPVIFINGINTSLAGARETAASVGELTGTKVDLVYNSSDPAVGAKVTFGHFHKQATQKADAEAAKGTRWSLLRGLEFPFMVRRRVYREAMASATFGREGGEWAKAHALNNPPASQTAANLILEQLRATNGPVNVVGYSQGGAIASDALRKVESHLVASYGREKANEMLGRVRFMGLGAAAERDDFPSAVYFSGIAHKGDVVPKYFGISRGGPIPAFGAILSALTPGNGFGVEQHINYLDDQHGAGSAGDSLSESLVRKWFGGTEIGERIIRDFEE